MEQNDFVSEDSDGQLRLDLACASSGLYLGNVRRRTSLTHREELHNREERSRHLQEGSGVILCETDPSP
ncbi:hypothetical protein Y1Q_0009415 [Alligator mississippiensis]|uniref:Uncharacterized protein n=1 Tax=Alligator mississippiensis TaxID=8496 RepID=A0A151N7S2_ALLMI|nr:hypothetical protein Y1Q_0009415 [Alligator mississippiensis]